MNELIEYAQSIISYLETNGTNLNVESQQALGSLLQNILQLIEQQAQEPQIPNQHPPLQEAMPSSNVEGFAYDDKNQRMYVRFLGKYPDRQGPVYQYEGVPNVIFNLFRTGAVPARTNGRNRWGRWWRGKVPSIGASLYTLIKNQGYDYRRVA